MSDENTNPGGDAVVRLESLFARTGFRVWSLRTRGRLQSVEVPTDLPRAHASGPDPDRILLFGSDILVGRGVLSHDIALPGFLARSIAQVTGRGVDVVVEAHSVLTMEQAVSAARSLELDRYDAVLVDLGLADALAGTAPEKWAAQLETLLQIFTAGAASSAHLFFVGCPDPAVAPVFRSTRGLIVAEAFTRFNERSERVIAVYPNASYLDFPLYQRPTGGRFATASTFAGFATALAPAVIAHLEAEFIAGAPRSEPVASESRRQRSIDRLGILDTPPELRFDRIVAQAQHIFGTKYASFNLIDRDRRWSKSHIGPGAADSDRSTEFCNLTIHTHNGLFVEDATQHALLQHNPLVTGDPHVRFYAGYPIEAPDGQRLGALCVYDTAPRKVTDLEEILLRELAVQIERELWFTPKKNPGILSRQAKPNPALTAN